MLQRVDVSDSAGGSCRQSLTVEALGWTEFGLSMMAMAATCLWIRANRGNTNVNDCLKLASTFAP